MNKLFVCLPVFYWCSGVAFSQTDSGIVKQGYIASYWHNGIGLVKEPFKWRGDQWAKAGGLLALTAIVLSTDEAINPAFERWQTNTAVKFGDAGYILGWPPVQFGATTVVLGAGAIAKNKPLQNFALDNLQAQVYTSGLCFVVKHLAHRSRPNTGAGAFEWHGPFASSTNRYQSFYSGHTALAFSTATMIFLHSRKKWWVGAICYTAATGVGISRMQRQEHWASDVLMGAILGSAVSSYVYKRQEARRTHNLLLKPLP